jgi:hypothetical protein
MAGRGMEWLVKAWPGVARQGKAGVVNGLRPAGRRESVVRTGDSPGHGLARQGWARQGTARHGKGFAGSGPLAVACGCERTGDGSMAGVAGLGGAWPGLARQDSARRGKARFGQCGLRPVAGIRCLERTGDGLGHGVAGLGKAWHGRGSNPSACAWWSAITEGEIRRRGVETVDPADHLAQASRPMDGISIRRN